VGYFGTIENVMHSTPDLIISNYNYVDDISLQPVLATRLLLRTSERVKLKHLSTDKLL
jgi:hypothetical protein